MYIDRTDATRDLDVLRRELGRLFEDLFPGVAAPATRPSRAVFLPGRAARSYPLLNLSEDKEAVYVEALMPGIDPASLEVSVLGTVLTISGEKPAPANVKAEEFHRQERGAGRFVRQITLPFEVDDTAIRADYKHGLLQVVLPKAASARPRQIAVNLN